MSTSTFFFGPGDYGGYNNFVWSGLNTLWTVWNGTWLGSGQFGRIVSLACRWDAYSGAGSGATGHNDLWEFYSGGARVLATVDYNVGAVGLGTGQTMHNVSTADFWQDHGTFAIGFYRHANQSSIVGFRTGSGSLFAKSADDGDVTGGSSWGSGALPCYAAVVQTQVWVDRGGYRQCVPYVWRSGAWVTSIAWVDRSGWQYQNRLPLGSWLRRTERHIPERGLPVHVWSPERGWERGQVTEAGMGWFGTVDPTVRGWAWDRPGHYRDDSSYCYTGRQSSADHPELVDRRLYVLDRWQRASRAGNELEAARWKARLDALMAPQGQVTPATIQQSIPTASHRGFRRSLLSMRQVSARPSTTSSAQVVSVISGGMSDLHSGERTQRSTTSERIAARSVDDDLLNATLERDCA